MAVSASRQSDQSLPQEATDSISGNQLLADALSQPALQRAKQAVAQGEPAVVNVVTDRIAARTTVFTDYST